LQIEVPFLYTVFGLTVRSDLAIPGLTAPSEYKESADLEIHWGASPGPAAGSRVFPEELTYVSSYADESGRPGLQIWKTADGTYLHLVYYDGIEFWLEQRGKSIWTCWPEKSTLNDALSYLLGPVLGLLLRLRGVTCLHASAVALNDCSIVFVGSAGAGKSTTAAALARQGLGVLSDDVAALEEVGNGFHVVPAYPHLCLWADSVEALYGSSEVLPQFSAGWEKRRLVLGEQGTRFEDRSRPLGAIYLLGERRPDPAPYVEAVKPQAALLSLVAETFATKVLTRDLRAREFAVLGRLVLTVPVRRVYPNREPARLEELCNAIRKDVDSLNILRSSRTRA
jgi:hypothetical protein